MQRAKSLKSFILSFIISLGDDRKPTTDISKEVTTTNCKDQQRCEEVPITCIDSSTPQNHAKNEETSGREELKSSPLSCSNSGDTNMTNGNNTQHESGNLSALKSDGDADVISPGKIGLDSPPGTCVKRSVSTSDISENEFQRYHVTTFKKMKRLSLSEEDVADKINSAYSSIPDVTHNEMETNDTVNSSQHASRDVQGVTQQRPTERLTLNEEDYEEGRVANVLRREISNFEVKNKASVPSNFQDVTQGKRGVTQKAGVSEASSPDEIMEPDNENMAAKEIHGFPVNGNENKHGVMYYAPQNDTLDTTLETGLTQNEDNEKQISFGLDDTQNDKGFTTQDTSIMATEGKELAETSLERGLMDEVGEGAHNQTYLNSEKGK